MPELFDAAWEFYELDPEIEWILATSASGITPLESLQERFEDHQPHAPAGFRFGPLRMSAFTYLPERTIQPAGEPPTTYVNPLGKCRWCKEWFLLAGRDPRYKRYCSPSCGGKSVSIIFHDTGCPVCGNAVKPTGKGNSKAKKYCTRKCMKAARSRRYRVRQIQRGMMECCAATASPPPEPHANAACAGSAAPTPQSSPNTHPQSPVVNPVRARPTPARNS